MNKISLVKRFLDFVRYVRNYRSKYDQSNSYQKNDSNEKTR